MSASKSITGLIAGILSERGHLNLDAEVTTLHANLRLMIEEENRDGHLSIALCRIAKNANGAWAVAQEFIPPLVEIAGSAQLEIMLRRLLDILLVKSEALAARHRERVKSIVEYGTSDIASFWLLHTVNRSFPLLNHFLATPTHPEALYASLAQLCGELMTFSSELTLKDIPPYRHENLSEVFSRLLKSHRAVCSPTPPRVTGRKWFSVGGTATSEGFSGGGTHGPMIGPYHGAVS